MNTTTPPQLPRSSALAEAEPESLIELFSRNPTQNTDSHYDQIIHAMRDLRVRLEGTETVRHARVKRDNPLRPTKNLNTDFGAMFSDDEGEES